MIGNKTGKLGEDIAEMFLTKHGFDVFTRNFLKKYGEIDIIAKKEGIIHFIEVKSVSCEIENTVLRETMAFRPEDNLHPDKLKKLSRVIQSYIFSNNVDKWQFDLFVVYIDKLSRRATVKVVENLVLPE